MPNQLANSNSPYLLQHQDNPVDWHPWGEEALAKAKAEDKPIFLSIGYAACHWCHVMAHESFEDADTAALMNQHFVNIKVDREERPDIDGIYMDAVVTLTGSGGWPMSVFLTPDGQPFLGGTYFPPVARHNLPAFKDLLQHVQRLWAEERDKVFEVGGQLLERIRSAGLPQAAGEALEATTLDKASMKLAQNYDWTHGGWGRAPKFPQPMTIDFLLGRATEGDRMAKDMALHALRAMAQGGMYDVVGGGFARYSVDDRWLVPHFEKMLYDNAQLARAYLHAYLVSGDEALRRVCERTLDFVARELRDASGGFYSSLDADSEGEEGKFYVWWLEEIKKEIKKPEIRDLFVGAYGVTAEGNFEGHNVLQRVQSDAELAETFDLSEDEVRTRLDAAHPTLLAARARRVRPGTDDKALTAWNALMLAAFAEAGRYLGRADYIQIARANAEFLLSELHDGQRLLRSWRAGRAAHNAYLEDYAALILALLALYQSDPDARWYTEAERLADEMLGHFKDAAGGFFDTRDDHEKLVTRPKDLQDNATPCGNSLAALALLQLAAYSGRGEWQDVATQSLAALQAAAGDYPTSFGQWLSAMRFALGEGREIAILGAPDGKDTRALLDIVWSAWRPLDVVAISPHPPAAGAPALLNERPLLDGKASAYVCQHFVCQRPVNEANELKDLL
ncbi:MAG: thioredoxin domain-containing protein [Chloroflexi bacterium]|nr:thioredoxin domain-containing protein [Chloroflexota bacterium]